MISFPSAAFQREEFLLEVLDIEKGIFIGRARHLETRVVEAPDVPLEFLYFYHIRSPVGKELRYDRRRNELRKIDYPNPLSRRRILTHKALLR